MLLTTFIETVATLCQEAPVRFAVLYGSQARGCARPQSDYDVAIWVEATDI